MSETTPPPPPPGVHIDRPSPRPKVDLSTTSLILIALIVGVCAGSGHRSHEKEFNALNARIDRLEKKIDQLNGSRTPSPAR